MIMEGKEMNGNRKMLIEKFTDIKLNFSVLSVTVKSFCKNSIKFSLQIYKNIQRKDFFNFQNIKF